MINMQNTDVMLLSFGEDVYNWNSYIAILKSCLAVSSKMKHAWAKNVSPQCNTKKKWNKKVHQKKKLAHKYP